MVLSVEALKAAVLEAKKGKNLHNYNSALEKLLSVAPDEPEAIYDQEWCETTKKKNAVETDRLETQLKGYKNNLIKESIRVNDDIVVHYIVPANPRLFTDGQ